MGALQFRLTDEERAGFQQAARLAGLSVSSWARERLRKVAAEELKAEGKPVPFLDEG